MYKGGVDGNEGIFHGVQAVLGNPIHVSRAHMDRRASAVDPGLDRFLMLCERQLEPLGRV